MLVRSSSVSARSSAVADHLIQVTTALAVVAVASVAAIISYQHAYELASTHGERGLTARLLPFTVDGLIWAASMVVLDASRRGARVPPLAGWSLGVGIVATVGANLAHGLGHGPIGALVSAWPAVALIGSFELLMMLVRSARRGSVDQVPAAVVPEPVPELDGDVPPVAPDVPALEHVVRDRHEAGHSQRAIARDLSIDRRKVKRIIEQVA
jgi:hypothetical protein